MLKLEQLRFRYPAQTDHYEFSMQAHPSCVTAISGRSGSGKSTLFDLIAGFLQPLSGELSWNNQDISQLSADQRPITMLFQKNNLFEHRNAIDNVVVGINPSIPATGADTDKAGQALDSVGLSEHYHQRVSTLSGGQQQRVAIARALIRNRGIVLLDEPFNALDQQTRMEMLTLVRGLADNQGFAVIMVTHDPDDIAAIADQHYRIVDGRLLSQSA